MNTGPLDWESSALTTRPLLHEKINITNLILFRQALRLLSGRFKELAVHIQHF